MWININVFNHIHPKTKLKLEILTISRDISHNLTAALILTLVHLNPYDLTLSNSAPLQICDFIILSSNNMPIYKAPDSSTKTELENRQHRPIPCNTKIAVIITDIDRVFCLPLVYLYVRTSPLTSPQSFPVRTPLTSSVNPVTVSYPLMKPTVLERLSSYPYPKTTCLCCLDVRVRIACDALSVAINMASVEL